MKKRDPKSSGLARLRYGGISTIVLLMVIASLIALNAAAAVLEKRGGWRLDFSFNGITTQSGQTREVLKNLQHPVHIYALFSKGEEDEPLMELLDRYAAASPLFTWEQADPGLNPTLLSRFSSDTETVSSDSIIVSCEETGRWRILSPADFISLSMDEETGNYSYAGYTYERSLTSAIAYVTRDEVPRIVISQGHGELDGSTLADLDDFLTENYYDVVYASLTDQDFTLSPKDLLVFFSPMRDLSDAEMEKVTAFTGEGGSILFTCDYSDPIGNMPNFNSLMRSYGFIPKDGIVVADREDAEGYYNNTRIDLIPEMLSTDITMELVASGADTLLLPGARAFQEPEDTDRNLIVSGILQSREASYLKKLTSTTSSLEKEETDETGPFLLALQARRITTQGYVSRAFVSGCSPLFTEEQLYAMTDNRQLIIRVIEFLSSSSASSLSIEAKNAIRPGLSVRSNGAGSLIITALPLSVLLAALLILVPRRNR